jgi:hypothetical protein
MHCLENHGYSLADAAIRKHLPSVCAAPAAAFCWPYEDAGTDAAAEKALAKSSQRRLLRDLWRFITSPKRSV